MIQTPTDSTPEPAAEASLEFRHETIDAAPKSGRLSVCLPTDLTGNGYPDLIVGGMGAENVRLPVSLPGIGEHVSRNLPVLQRALWFLEDYVFWYENPGPAGGEWKRHVVSKGLDERVFANALFDVNGDGRLDLVVAQGWGGRHLYWYEQPEDPRQEWTRRTIHDEFWVYHDIAFGDVDNDGEMELVAASQESKVLFYLDVPEDPTQQPWPAECRHVIDEGERLEGLAIADLDGDGENELVAGPHVYEMGEHGWERETLVEEWYWARVAVGDVDGDGEPEIVLTEGDSPHLEPHRPGRVAWFDRVDGEWEMHPLREEMFCPHTVQIADFDGDGNLDVYVAEMGLGTNPDPEHVVFFGNGDGTFEERTVARGVATHEAKAVDVDGDGRLDIIGKSYEPDIHVDVWYNEAR